MTRHATLVGVFLLLGMTLHATTYYIRTDGSDSNNGLANNAGGAWLTIQHASGVVAAGDTVHLASGVYPITTAISTTTSGTSIAPITFISDVKWGARLVVSDTAAFTDIWSQTGDYVTIQNIEIQGCTTLPCPGTNQTTYGIRNEASNDKILNNLVHDIPGFACPARGGAGIYIGNYTATGNVTTDSNITHDIGDPTTGCDQIHGIYQANKGGIVTNNISYRNAAWGIHLNHNPGNGTVANNLVFQNGRGGITLSGDSSSGFTCANEIVSNNLVMFNGGFTGRAFSEAIREFSATANNQFINNLIYGNANNSILLLTGDGSTVLGTITSNPQLVNYQANGSGDYRLSPGSPAINGGTSTGAPSTDFNGTSRPQGSAPDIGAYESLSTCGPTVAAGQTCIINVEFQPTATGTRTGNVTITDNAQGSPQLVPLTGTGIAATAPIVSLSPTSINFGSVPLGTTTNIAATSTGWANCITVACAGGAVDATSATQTFGANSLLTVVGPPHSNALFFYKLNGSSRNGVTNWLDDFIVNIGSSGASAQTFEYDIGHFVSGTAFLYGTQCNQVVGFWQVWNELAQAWVNTSLACSLPVSTDHHIIWSFSRSGSNMIYNSVTIDGVLHPINMTEPSGPRPTFTDAVAVNFQMDIGASGTTLNETVKSANIWANPQTVTLTNTGNATLNITSIAASGDFSVPVTTCGSTLSALASCTITIGFAPSAVGTRNGILTITDNASGSPHTVPLTGVGTNATTPVASISPTSLTFANQVVSTISTGQNLTLTNIGNGPLNITSITASGDYARTTTCGASLAAAASCSITVTFTPTALGTRTGSIAITDNAAGSPQMIPLTGTGVPAPQPAVSFSPATLTFPNTFVGVTTPTQDITLTNVGTATLNIASITASGDYARTTSCGATLAPSVACLIHVSFTPTAPGPRAGLISVTDDAPGSPQTVSLNGQGIATAPAVCLNRSSVPFGNQPVGTTSGTQPVVVTDCGTAPLIVSSVTPSSNFTAATTCGMVAVGATCNVNIAFAPSTAGTLTGTVQVASNAASSPDVITTSGFGTQTGATITPTSVAFGTVVVGVQSAGTLLTLSNIGNTTITPNTPTFSGTNPTDFSFTGSCATLAANASCMYSVFFTPGSAGARSGVFNQTFTGAPSPVTVTLTGTGQATAPAVTLTPSSINFGSVTQGTSTPVQTIQLTNSGTANLVVTSVTATGTNSGDVTLSADHCSGVTLTPGTPCTVSVAMTPASTGARSANAHFITNAASSPNDVTLAVIGLVAPAPQATFTPTTLAFGNVKTGQTSAAQTVTVGNIGNASLTISSVTLAGANPTQYSQTNNCATVIPNNTCAVTVNFIPTTIGSKPATLVIVSNDPTNPTETITLTGTGRGHPKAVIGVTSINFGSTILGTTSGPAAFTITNTGDATLNVSTITTAGDTFPQNNTCTCCPIAPATSCSVNVQFNPQILCGQFDVNNPTTCLSDVHLGTLTVTSDADQTTQNVALQGLAIPVPPPPGPITITLGGVAKIGGTAVIGVQ